MGKKLQTNDNLPKHRKLISRAFHHVTSFIEDISHNKLLAYCLVTLAIICGVSRYDRAQQIKFARAEQKARIELAWNVYHQCVDLNVVRDQANERIRLLKIAQRAGIFVSEREQGHMNSLVNKVRPLPMQNCERLRPSN